MDLSIFLTMTASYETQAKDNCGYHWVLRTQKAYA